MNWENTDFCEDKGIASWQNGANAEDMSMEVEQKKLMELNKFQDPKNNLERQEYITLMNRFGELLASQCFDDIKKDLLAEDCLCFLFNFFQDKSVVYSLGSNHFVDLYNGVQIKQRVIRTTHVDVEKNTGIHICEYQVLYEGSTEPIEEVAFETFSFNCCRITNYKAFFGAKVEAHGHDDPFEITFKDIMLAKVKEFNYTLAGQPDLEKVASLLHETTQYKIWSWDGQKRFTFRKEDFVNNFHTLEENFTIERIVPYEIYSETRETTYIVSTYVYHLENKTTCPGKKFMWLSTCIFTFDNCLNFAHISQQGELYPEGEAEIPFESFSRERVEKRVWDLTQFMKGGSDLFYNEKVDFDCIISRYGPTNSPRIGYFKGLKQIEKLQKSLHNMREMNWFKMVDTFVDLDDSSYDVAITINCAEGIINANEYRYNGQLINFVGIIVYYLENGKLAKVFQCFCDVPEVIVSPFSDPGLEGVNIKPLRHIL